MELKEITEELLELNTTDKISCISGAMVDMAPDNIIDMLRGLRENAKKIIDSHISRAQTNEKSLADQLQIAKSQQQRLMTVIEQL